MSEQFFNLYNASIGLNTKLDPQRLSSDPNKFECSKLVNISIDDRGLFTLRKGFNDGIDGEFHSLFCSSGDSFVVREYESSASLMQIINISPLTLSSIRSDLDVDRTMIYDQIGNDTFYSNGNQKGYIRSGVSYNWPIQSYYGPDADMQFATEIPAISQIAFLSGGQLIIAVGNALFSNHAPYQYGLFSPGAGNIASFQSDVKMIASVNGGFYASDEETTWFFKRTENWYFFQQIFIENVPIITGSLAYDKIKLSDIGINSDGFGRVWTSNNGVCIGGDYGVFENLTDKKVVYPQEYTSGACLIKDKVVINTTI